MASLPYPLKLKKPRVLATYDFHCLVSLLYDVYSFLQILDASTIYIIVFCFCIVEQVDDICIFYSSGFIIYTDVERWCILNVSLFLWLNVGTKRCQLNSRGSWLVVAYKTELVVGNKIAVVGKLHIGECSHQAVAGVCILWFLYSLRILYIVDEDICLRIILLANDNRLSCLYRTILY